MKKLVYGTVLILSLVVSACSSSDKQNENMQNMDQSNMQNMDHSNMNMNNNDTQKK
jgi:major membrane immunogen (membrane-anchored lipoprotein)